MTPPTGHPRSTLPKPDRAPATPPPADPLTVAQRRILDAVRKRPMTAGEITSYVMTCMTAEKRDTALADLVKRRLITTVEREGQCGRHRKTFTFYEAVEGHHA